MNSGESAPSAGPARRNFALAGGTLALLTLAAYHNSFHGPLLFDDNETILNNPTIRHLWPLSTVFHPPFDTTAANRPLLNLTFALNYAVSGLHTWSYHGANLLIHILAGLTLFGLVRRTLLQPVLRTRFGPTATLAAFASALLWLVHPVQTECVTYIVERAESLMGLFYLLTLYGFIRGYGTGSEGDAGLRTLGAPSCAPRCGASESEKTGQTGRWRGWLGLSWLACLFAMWTKEAAVTAPLMVLFYDRAFVSGTFRESWRRHRGLYLGLAATWLAFAPLVAAGGRRDVNAGFGVGIPFWGFLGTQFHAMAHYLRVAFWPHPLRHYYELDGHVDYTKVAITHPVFPYVLVVAPLFAGTVWALWRRPVVGFAGAWFFGILAPTSLVPASGDILADRRLYLTLAAILVPLVAVTCAWLGRRALPLVLALAVFLAFATTRRNRVYASELAFWSDQEAKYTGDPLAHYNLGCAWQHLGRSDEALKEFDRTLDLDPGFYAALANKGGVLLSEGRPRDAVPALEQALELSPNQPAVRDALGDALVGLGRQTEAILQYREALRAQPDYADALGNLGSVLDHTGRPAEAIPEFVHALRLEPNRPQTHDGLGIALAQTGRLPEAVAQFREALRLDAGSAAVHCDLGIALSQQGRLTDALREFQEAVRLAPDLIGAHENLGVALRAAGRTTEAKAQFAIVARLKAAQP